MKSPRRDAHHAPLYILDDAMQVMEAEDEIMWAEWFALNDNVMARTGLEDDTLVSTIFLGVDQDNLAVEDGVPPVVFETVIFWGSDWPKSGPEVYLRYCTHEAAMAGHEAAVQRARTGDPPPENAA